MDSCRRHAGNNAKRLGAPVPFAKQTLVDLGVAAALVNGWGLRSLGHVVGLADRTLSKTLGSLADQVRKPTWIRDHFEEWSGACRAAGAVVQKAVLYVLLGCAEWVITVTA